MDRAFFKITAAVAIAGSPPGHIVHIEVDDGGVPVDLYWRRRLRDNDIAPYAVAGDASDTKSTPKAAKKGA